MRTRPSETDQRHVSHKRHERVSLGLLAKFTSTSFTLRSLPLPSPRSPLHLFFKYFLLFLFIFIFPSLPLPLSLLPFHYPFLSQLPLLPLPPFPFPTPSPFPSSPASKAITPESASLFPHSTPPPQHQDHVNNHKTSPNANVAPPDKP